MAHSIYWESTHKPYRKRATQLTLAHLRVTVNKKTLSEQEIRTRYITPAVQRAGWQPQQIREEYYFTDGRMHVGTGRSAMRGERSYADYLLIHRNVPLALIEAKDNNHGVGGGMQQALRYGEALDVPFVYSSNGDAFQEHDRTGASHPIERNVALDDFPGPEALWQRYVQAQGLTEPQQEIVTQPYHFAMGGHEPRYYQRVAISRTVTAIAQGDRRVLLVMATGTGKTYTAFQIIWRLRRAGRVDRVLFLADRNLLVDQAKNEDFKHFGDKMMKIQNRQIDKAFEIYLALYQGVSGTEEAQNVYREFSPDFFDLVVVDECHRGSAAADSAWREILEYFQSAVQIGLTATPKEDESVSNIDYFGEPLYTYSLKQGIADGFLAPYKVLRVHLDADVDGWRPTEGQLDRYGNLIEQREYGIGDYDRRLVIDERTKLVAERIAEYMRATDPYQKTIVFCVDIDHAERMRMALVNAIGGEAASNRRYIMRITGDNDEGRNELDNFKSVEERYPVIAITSKLLTTGVNVPTCQLIVLDAMINSMIEFKQIIGRGTRLRPDLGKTHFTIIDFRNATRLFRDPDFDGDPIQAEDFSPGEPLRPRAVQDEPMEEQPDHAGDATGDEAPGRTKYVVDGVEVRVLAEQVQHYDANGRLVTKSFQEFSRENVRKIYGSLDEFLQKWRAADRKEAVLAELLEHGLMLDKLQAQTDDELDPFDLICAIAFDQTPMTRQDRARRARGDDLFSQYGEVARRVLTGLLDKYADTGISALEEAGDAGAMRKVLQLAPFHEMGSPIELVNAFGGRDQYVKAVRRLQDALYAA